MKLNSDLNECDQIINLLFYFTSLFEIYMPRLFLFAFLLNFSTQNTKAQNLMRGPYMTMATPTSVTIHWRTDLATNSQVKYSTNPNNLNTAVNIAPIVNEHVMTLTGLQPDTKYYYSIGTSLFAFQGDSQNYFRTAPIASKNYEKPIRFWAVGDMGKKTQQQIDVRESFKKYVDTNFIAGWLMLGDNAYDYGSDTDYQLGFFDYYQKDITKHIVLWPCLGNHDYANNYLLRTNHQIPYLDIFSNPQNAEMGGVASNTERYYSFNYGNIHFVNLDSYGLENVSGNYYGLADTAFSPQIQWLKYDLSMNTLPWVVVSFHHPPYCMGTHNSDSENDLIVLRTNLNPILEKYNVDLVLNGHCHTYQRSNMIKNHFGLAATYDSTLNLIQNSSGKYDGSPNSCVYIKNNTSKKDSGVIYMVVGSGSAVPYPPMPTWPHQAMQYSNYENNGSLLVTVEGNELHAEWISTDTAQVVKDRFTIMKNVNKLKHVYCKYPAIVTLKAGWSTPPFAWSTGDSVRTINILATHDTFIYVTDKWNCITDTFQIQDSIVLSNPVESAQQQIKVYPNPTTQDILIEVAPNTFYEYRITDENGKIMMKDSLFCVDKFIKLNLAAKMAAGNYILSIKSDKNQQFTSKITLIE